MTEAKPRGWRERVRALAKWTGLACVSVFVSFWVVYFSADWIYLQDPAVYESDTMPADVRGQLNHFYAIWDDPQRREAEHEAMHVQNPEWDLVSRSFYCYALANVALRWPDERERAIEQMDLVIEDTLAREWRSFLLPYGNERPFVRQPAASIMVDGELSLMIGLRRMVRDEPGYAYREKHGELIKRCREAMEDGPLLVAECYPDECWLFCNPLALVSMRVYDVLEGTDHSDLVERWCNKARGYLVDERNGLFYSAVTLKGEVLHWPEGSTIWIGAYCLEPIAPELAHEQYALMKRHLSGGFSAFRFGREWPHGESGSWDIDSGFTPFGMGPASTGFALVTAKELDDDDFFKRLLAFLQFVAVPTTKDGRMHYQSSNLVGDATFLLAKVTGPAWDELERRLDEAEAAKANAATAAEATNDAVSLGESVATGGAL